jgi:hypothetical protein
VQGSIQSREHAAGVELEHLRSVVSGEVQRLDVAAGVVEVVPGLRIDSADGAHHLGPKEDVVDVDNVKEQVMPGWWYTQVSKKTFPITPSSSGGRFNMSATPRNLPQGTAPRHRRAE